MSVLLSPTTWAWWTRSPTGSSSCTPARSSRARPSARALRRPRTRTRRASCAACPALAPRGEAAAGDRGPGAEPRPGARRAAASRPAAPTARRSATRPIPRSSRSPRTMSSAATTPHRSMPEPLLSTRGLAKRYAVARNVLGRPTSCLEAVRGVDLDVATGETVALVGESGCGKSTLARLALAADRAERGCGRVRRARHLDASAARTCARFRKRGADRLPGSVRLARPALQRGGDHRRGPARPGHAGRPTARADARGARPGRAAGRHRRPLPARVLGRPAPADLDRPGDRRRPALLVARRAGERARRVGAVQDPEPADRPAAPARPDLLLHQPRHVGRAPRRRPGRGDVPGPGRGAGARRPSCSPTRATPTPRRCCRRRRRYTSTAASSGSS